MRIEGYFSKIKTANETAARLKGEGFKSVFVDINEHITNAYSQRGPVGSEGISSLSEAVFGEGGSRGEDVNSPLAAASPMASGMGGFQEIGDINCKVVIEANQASLEEAQRIIKNMGGTLEDPNGKIPEGLENIDEDALILKNLENR